jgi:uncharacterized membrane protein
MAEDTNVPSGEMQGGTSNPKGEIPTTPPATGEIPGTTPPPTESLEDIKRERETLRAALKSVNKESASHRIKAEELDRLKAEQEAATLNETQKLQKQLEKVQTDHANVVKELQQTKLTHAVSLAAQKLGFYDPSDAIANIDQSQLDENFSNVEGLLKQVLSKKPHLASTGKPVALTSGGATNPPNSQTSGEITEQYLQDVTNGKIDWNTLTKEQKTKIHQELAKRTHF